MLRTMGHSSTVTVATFALAFFALELDGLLRRHGHGFRTSSARMTPQPIHLTHPSSPPDLPPGRFGPRRDCVSPCPLPTSFTP